MIPTLHTARLTLRPHVMADFERYADMLADPERSRFMGGPHDRRKAWSWFCGDIAEWHLMNHGSLAITLTTSGDYIGQVAIIRPIHFPEEELGWSLFGGFEGRGYMTEAATAMRDWAFGPRGLTTMVSYIDPANTRSINVAKRLGATLDPQAATPNNDPTGVWRHVRAA
jgi:RimJ/RimL family protein N-acetyltransferase